MAAFQCFRAMQVPQTKQWLESLGPEIQICLLNIRTLALQLCALMVANPGYGVGDEAGVSGGRHGAHA